MKIVKLIFFILLALGLIACTGIFLFFQTYDTDQYLPQVTQKVSVALGRSVTIGQVGLGFSRRGITLDAWPLTVADDPDFTTQPFVRVDRVRISLDLRALVFQHEIHIKEILLQSPQIHFIRSQEGRINIQSLGHINSLPPVGKVGEGLQAPVASNSVGTSSKGPIPSTSKGHVIDIKSIKIQDGSISFIDQSQSVPLDLWLSDINVSLNNFSLSKPFPLLFKASFYNNYPNVRASAMISLDLSKRAIRINDLSLHANLSRLDLERLKDITPQTPDGSVFNNISGVIQLDMASLGIGASGNWEANGGINITDGLIKNFNVIKTVLSYALGSFGGIDINNLLNNGPLKEKLGKDHTVIEKAEVKFSLHDKAVSIANALIKTDIFEFTAQGSVDQGLNTDMQTMLHINNDVSAALINELDGLKLLCDDSNRIAIDATLKGVIPHLKYKPNKDFRKKSKKVLMEEGGNILSAILSAGQDPSGQGSNKKMKKTIKNFYMNFLQ